jgi:adenine-specific DNA glycosylase
LGLPCLAQELFWYFSNSICLKIPRCGECPLQNICEYYVTDGRKEEGKGKKSQSKSFDTKKAKVYLFLHANHKEYYSTNKKTYKHFVLSAKINTRELIKKYFREKYQLELSVRPPHKKIFVNGQPVMLVNAQIQTGKHSFFVFSKKSGVINPDILRSFLLI